MSKKSITVLILVGTMVAARVFGPLFDSFFS
jgi:hypothetical protein